MTLFVLVGQVLSIMWEKDEKAGLIEDIEVGTNGERIAHLQFADTFVLFWESCQVFHLKVLLYLLQIVTGLKINKDKYEVINLNFDESHCNRFQELFDMSLSSLPIKYLGLPLSNRGTKSKD